MKAIGAGSMADLQVRIERLRRSIGWAGVIGLSFFMAAAVVSALAWSERRAFVRSSASLVVEAIAHPSTKASLVVTANTLPPVLVGLPPASDIPLLLTQMKHAAVSNGLAWRAAEYRTVEATSTHPASVEVRCSIKGPYPNLRSMLVQLTELIPALAIREFSASRPNADTASVEAKLALAVFLRDGAFEAGAPMPTKTEGQSR